MGSDRARVSYDANKHYRAVIAQQGRVTLEADWNEAQQITHEEMREQALDIVGSSGTPDNGYEVLQLRGSSDFGIRKGTMYVGGMRVSFDEPLYVVYGAQQSFNWLDWENHDPYWVDPRRSTDSPIVEGPELVYLYLREQEVSAVEDLDLLDPALGGPDTTQRSYLIQHIVRYRHDPPSTINNCETALTAVQEFWEAQGLAFNPETMRLDSQSRLQATFTPPLTSPSLCDPRAETGYLGAENQLIRVKISAVSSAETKLVWGFDNASYLYRVEEEGTNATTLRLRQHPIDEYHWPRVGQAVEVLPAAAKLSNGEYVAATTGVVYTLREPYDPDRQTITLPSSLSDWIWNGTSLKTPALFVRVWEGEETFARDTAVTLGETGLQITLTTEGSAPFHVGSYWQIGIRPKHPTTVYPKRYLGSPQPPDGPRLWVCPLAVIRWLSVYELIVLEDCRKHFSPITKPTAIHVIDANWANDDIFPLSLLREGWGLEIYFDRALDPESVKTATMIVTLEVPEPGLVPSPPVEVENEGSWFTNWVGVSRNFILNGAINYNSTPLSTISWHLPGGLFDTFMNILYDTPVSDGFCARIRITLKASSIWTQAKGQYLYLDGQAFAQRSQRGVYGRDRTALKLPSGAGAKASDFESWFWIKLDDYPYPSVAIGDFLL